VASPETGDKTQRAMPLASQVNAGNVSLVAAVWNRALLDELGGFPSAKHDDCVDALSRGASELMAPRAAARRVPTSYMTR
jgi:predicted phage terminase large subunit-like protein